MAFQVVPAFSGEFAAGLRASPVSRLAVMGTSVLMTMKFL